MTQSKRRGEALSERDCRKSSNSLLKKLQGGASPPSQCTSMKYSLQPHRYVDLYRVLNIYIYLAVRPVGKVYCCQGCY